jgi:cell division protein ZapA
MESKEERPGTAVTIFGRTYVLRGEHETDRLERLAELLDRRMQDVAESTGTADTLKVAILAALNLADEHLGVESSRGGDSSPDAARLTRLAARLDEALAEVDAAAEC